MPLLLLLLEPELDEVEGVAVEEDELDAEPDELLSEELVELPLPLLLLVAPALDGDEDDLLSVR
ncbi:MAG TPA: hypothetical protein VN779_02190 [Actinocrinis sp.]|nr:hypothetical protein [Actinocrinis sp.]HXR69559.1 hypothetical protein [Actinocrinis sp.]